MSSYTVEAILKASTSQFTAGMREAMQAVEKLKSTTASLSSIGDSFIGIGSALTAGITAPLVAGVTSVIKSYADLEQAVGGVETLFKDSANAVIANSETAYQRAGVSGVKYMEQVTSFSATLLQGLGGDTAKAAAYGDKAIVQMSDNANKMGTSIESIQMAYQGFAKDNYTMLDNLKLGYGGTASEMARLVNESGVLNGEFEATAENVKDIPFSTLIDAIQVTQDKLGITGTTAREASETVSGSFQAMIASGKNLVAGLGSADADVGKLMENFKNTIAIFVKNIKRVLKNIWDNLPMAEWQKWVLAIVAAAGPIMIAIGGIMKAVSGIGSTFKTMGAILSNPFGLALVAISALVAGFIYAYNHSEAFRNKVNAAVEVVKAKFNELKAAVQPAIDSIAKVFKKTGAEAFAPLVAGVGVALVALKKLSGFKLGNLFKFPTLPNPFSGLANFAKTAVSAVKGVFIGIGKSVSAIFKGIGSGIANAFRGIGQALAVANPANILALSVAILAVGAAMALAGMQGAGIAKILQGIGSVIESVGQAFATVATAVIGAFAQAIVTIAPSVQAFVPVIHAIGEAIGTVVVAIGLVAPQLSILVNAFGTAFSSIIQAVGTAVQSIASGIAQIVTAFAPIVETIGNTIVQVTQTIMTNLPPVLEAVAPIVETLGNVFTTTAQIIANAIVQIVQALVPVMPAVAEVASAISSAVSSIAEAFASVVGQIAPIIDSLSNLFTSVGSAIQSALTPVAPIIEAFGNSIKSVFEGAADVIRSFGDAVKSILDGVSGVIKSIGEAIKDAGQGFKLFGEGVKLAGDHGLAAAAGIGAVATAVLGLGAASAGGNLNGFRADLDQLDTVMYKISSRNVGSVFSQMGSGMQTAASMVTRLTAGLPLVATAMQQLGPASTASATGVRSFAQGFSALGSSLSGAVPMFTQMTSSFTRFNTGMTTATSGLTMFGSVLSSIQGVLSSVVASLTSFLATSTAVNGSVQAMGASFMNLGSSLMTSGTMFGQLGAVMTTAMAQVASATISGMSRVQSVIQSSMMQAVVSVTSSMMQIVTIVRMSAVQMTQAGQQAGRGVANGVTNGIRAGIGSATAAMSALINAIRSTASAGASMMVSIGAYIGQGLAQGMYSALGAVTAAANALVAQAERAAQAKAKIHSPSRLFRDNVGIFIGQGVAVGIEKSTKYVNKAMNSMFDGINDFSLQVGDLMSDNLAYSFEAGRATSSVDVTYRREDSEQLGVIREALSTIKDMVARDVVLEIDGREFARTTGDDMTEYQNDRRQIENLLRGIR